MENNTNHLQIKKNLIYLLLTVERENNRGRKDRGKDVGCRKLMVCSGIVSPCEREMKLSGFLIPVDVMSQHNPVETLYGEWVDLLQ